MPPNIRVILVDYLIHRVYKFRVTYYNNWRMLCPEKPYLTCLDSIMKVITV